MRYLKHLVTIVLISVFTMHIGYAQNNSTKLADKMYEEFDFSNAAKAYEKVIKKDATNLHAKQKIADCYRLLNNSQMAEIWYGQLIATEGSDPIDKFYYAQALRNNGKYDEAKAYYEEYSKIATQDKRSAEI